MPYELDTAIVLIGRICSGKSTFGKSLVKHSGLPVISFGKYLVDYSIERNLPIDRQSLQNLGENFVETDHTGFLDRVLNHFPISNKMAIIDGVRHASILDQIRHISNDNISIFIYADQRTRYDRFVSRQKNIDDKMTYPQFVEMDSHRVESGIEELHKYCDFTLNSGNDDSQLIKEILKRAGLPT